MPDFFHAYFIDPIVYNTGYNIVNTAVFAVILVIAVAGVYRLLQRLGVKIDNRFFVGIAPFIALGGVLRAWEDMLEASKAVSPLLSSPLKDFILVDAAGIPRNLLLISPLMYVTVFVIALSALLLSILISRAAGWNYHRIWFAAGSVLIAIILLQLRFVNYFAMLLMLAIAAAWVAVFYLAKRLSGIKAIERFLTPQNYSILSVHMFDASTTFVALQFFPYFEQHVVAGFFTSVFGPAAMFALKLAVVPAVLYYLDKDVAEQDKKDFIKIAVIVLGMGPGLRNFLRLGMGV